jgi:hypothetical protein
MNLPTGAALLALNLNPRINPAQARRYPFALVDAVLHPQLATRDWPCVDGHPVVRYSKRRPNGTLVPSSVPLNRVVLCGGDIDKAADPRAAGLLGEDGAVSRYIPRNGDTLDCRLENLVRRVAATQEERAIQGAMAPGAAFSLAEEYAWALQIYLQSSKFLWSHLSRDHDTRRSPNLTDKVLREFLQEFTDPEDKFFAGMSVRQLCAHFVEYFEAPMQPGRLLAILRGNMLRQPGVDYAACIARLDTHLHLRTARPAATEDAT